MKFIITTICTLLFMQSFCQKELSYRYLQSPVKNQAQRGTCTAFGMCAAFEVLPGVPSNLSEQYLYARIKYDYYTIFRDKERLFKQGESLKNYIFTITSFGLISEERMPYDGTAPMATNDKDLFDQYKNITRNVSPEQMEAFQKESYRLTENQYTYLDASDAKDIETIKQALRSGVKAIPVGYSMHSAQWGDALLPFLLEPQIDLNGIMQIAYNNKWSSINEVKKFDPNIEEKILNGQVKTYPLYKDAKTGEPSYSDGGHCVTIVGYNQYGFIIKNSWGKNWGDEGYAIISYNYHKLFANEAIILKDFTNAKMSVASPFDILQGNQIRLKTIPSQYGSQKGLSMSFFYEGPKIFPEFEKIQIHFYTKRGLGANKGDYISSCYPQISEENYRNGYLIELPSSIAYRIANGEQLVTEIDFTYNVGTRTVTNIYGTLEWKNKMYANGLLGGYIDKDEE